MGHITLADIFVDLESVSKEVSKIQADTAEHCIQLPLDQAFFRIGFGLTYLLPGIDSTPLQELVWVDQ